MVTVPTEAVATTFVGAPGMLDVTAAVEFATAAAVAFDPVTCSKTVM